MNQICPLAKTLEFLGKKWALAILHELQQHPTSRFSTLSNSLPKISARTLSTRLQELEKHQLITKQKFAQTPPRIEYTLTKKGQELILCFRHLDLWVEKFEKK